MSYVSAVTNPAPKPRTIKIVDTQAQQEQQKNEVPTTPEVLETPPTSKGVTPSVTFDLRIPSTQQKKEGSGDSEEEDSNLSSISVDGLDQRQPKINEIANYLREHSDNRDFEISGGFVIYKVESGKDEGSKKVRLPEFEFGTIPLALGFLNAISELLTRPQTKSISLGVDDQLILCRSGNQILMRRTRGDDTSETWFQYEDLALALRKFGKKYLKVAQAVEHTLEKREERTDKPNKDKEKKKRIAVSEKLQTRNFRSTLKTMKEHFLKTDLPALKKKYQKQEQIKDQSKKKLSEQNRDMMAMALDAAPEGFMEMDISHIGKIDEPEPVVEEVKEEKKKEKSEETVEKPVKEKKKRKTKAEIRREQEKNFDNDEFFKTAATANATNTQQVQEAKTDGEEMNTRYQNAFDIGGLSEENIFELTQQHQPPEKKQKTKKKQKSKANKDKKKTTDSKKQQTTEVKKTQVSKKQKKQKNQPKQQQQQQLSKQKEEEGQQNYFVPVLAGLTMLAAFYYFYTLYQ